MISKEYYRESYNEYFRQFNALAVGDYSSLSYGNGNPNPTAGSLESIIGYANYIHDNNATILNSGAGASSWILRQIFNGVECNDPNELFLRFVEYVCSRNSITGGAFRLGWNAAKYDHVYYDYGDIERMPNLSLAIEAANKSVYVDDTNGRLECQEYRYYTISLCERLGLRYIELPEIFDKDGRGGLIIEK